MILRRSSAPVERIYAIGDVHGCFDLFKRLMAIVKRDVAGRLPVPTRIVLLGDIVDRGPDSARMVRGCMALTRTTDRFVVLKGNHEAMMVDALTGNYATFERWLEFGGRQTLSSWGVDADLLERGASIEAMQAASAAVGPDVLKWLSHLPLHHRHGEYLFVHAGIRPGVALSRQQPHDLLWITDDFLESSEDHGVTVVHGHTIVEQGPFYQSNRIGIDTGAYRTGELTALGIEGGDVWSLNTAPVVPRLRTREDAALDHYYGDLVARVSQRAQTTPAGRA